MFNCQKTKDYHVIIDEIYKLNINYDDNDDYNHEQYKNNINFIDKLSSIQFLSENHPH